MKVYVKNIKVSDLRKGEITKAVKFFASKLMTKRLADSLTINIIFDTEINFAGLCTWVDDYVRPKEFEITINPNHHEPDLLSIAHEMVHAKQYARGELKELISLPGQVNWKGVRKEMTNEGEGYMDQPWEVEAYAKEHVLYREYILECA